MYLHPEGLVLMQGFGRWRNFYKDGLDRLGVEVHVFNHRSVAEILRTVAVLGGMIGCEAKAAALVERLSAGRNCGTALPISRNFDGSVSLRSAGTACAPADAASAAYGHDVPEGRCVTLALAAAKWSRLPSPFAAIAAATRSSRAAAPALRSVL